MEENSLKSKSVKGASWSLIDSIANQGITFLVGLVLARLLSPAEYGLIGIITIFIVVFETMVDSGFSNALIRKNDADDVDYSTGFFTNLGFGCFLYIVLFLLAPYISIFFNEPALVSLLRVMGLIVIINSFALIQRTILVKKVDFKTQTKASLISSISSGIIGIGMAYSGLGVWALVGQQVSRQFLNTVSLWFFNRWIPRFVFSSKSFKELWGFGWKLLVSALLNTVWNEIYQVVIGKCYTTRSLGLYTRARQFGGIFSQNLTAVIQRVTYPVLSSIQDDKIRLKDAYRRVIKVSCLCSFALMMGLFGIARPMVTVLIGRQWIDCVPMLQIVCFSMMLYPLHSLNLNMLQVQGRSDLFLKLEIIKKVVSVIPLSLGIFVGIYWMLAAGILTSWISYYLNAYYSGPFLNYSFFEQLKDILPSMSISMAMGFILFAISFIQADAVILLFIQIVVGAIFMIIVCEIFNLSEYKELKNLFVNSVKLKH